MAALVALREDGDDYPPVTAASVSAAREAATRERDRVYRETGGAVFIDQSGQIWVEGRKVSPSSCEGDGL